MYKITSNHPFSSIEEAIKDAVQHGFDVEFVINERGFKGRQKKTYLPESVIELEVILFSRKTKQVLYLLKMVDGMCGWTSGYYGALADNLLSEHLTRIKENFADEL